MKRLNFEELYNNLHFVAISLILLSLSFKYYYVIPILIFYLIFVYKKLYFTVKVVIVITFIITVLLSCRFLIKNDENTFKGIIINKNENKYDLLTFKGKIYLVSYIDLELGDYGVFYTKDYEVVSNSLFDYEDYLENCGYISFKSLTKVEKLQNTFVLSKIQSFMIKRSDECGNLKGYINTLLFGIKDLEDDIYKNNQALGVSHLLAISGTHVSVFLFILMFFLDKLFYFNKPKNFIVGIFLIFLVLITNFSLSVIRSTFIYFAPLILGKKHHFTKLDYLSMIASSLIIFNPKIIYLTSFILSFFVSFILIVLIANFNNKNKIFQLFKSAFVIFLFTIPIVLNINYEINLLSFIISPISSVYFELILIPLALITYLFPSINKITVIFFDLYDSFTSYLSSINQLKIIFGKVSIFFIIIYFFSLLKIFSYKKITKKILWILSILLLLFLTYLKPYLTNNFEVKLLDVGQGDSILITYPKSEYVILVDSYNNCASYLKYYGIKKIDLLILTHGDSDHINDFIEVYERFRIKEIITSAFTTSDTLIEYIEKYQIKMVKDGYFNDYIQIIGPIKSSLDENNNSLVFKLKYQRITFLFMGDAEQDEEEDIVGKYGNNLKSDFLKAGHHGANNSSSESLLTCVKPEYVLISVGKNNKYGHPNNEYLLTNYQVLRTDLSGVITVRIKNKKIIIKKTK